MDTPAEAKRIEKITVCRSWPEATITFKISKNKFKEERYAPADQPESGYGYGIQNNIIINGGVLEQFAMDLKDPGRDDKWEEHEE